MEHIFFWIIAAIVAGELSRRLIPRKKMVGADLIVMNRHLRSGDRLGAGRLRMKWPVAMAMIAVAAPSLKAGAQLIILPIGKIATVADKSPTVWGMSGMEMVKVARTIGNETPIMRTLAWDARTVEILSRTQAPPLRASDVKTVSHNGRQIITVRRFLLMEVMSADSREAGVSKAALAQMWAGAIRKTLPQVAPMPSRFGI